MALLLLLMFWQTSHLNRNTKDSLITRRCQSILSSSYSMPTIPILPPKHGASDRAETPLPGVLSTPSGLAILEIQGTVNSSGEHEDGATLPIGQLHFPLYDSAKPATDTAWHKRVHLYVGKHQRLTGEVKKLLQPIALLQRNSASTDGGQALQIAEIVYYKLLFTHRPEPVGTRAEV